MKKSVKIGLISVTSLLAVILVILAVVIGVVFSPSRLTPIVKEQADKYLTCQTEFSSVDLTFFSTCPRFGLRLNDFLLVNPKEGAPSDTLVSVKECIAIVDVFAYLFHDNVVVQKFVLDDGHANVYVAPDSTTNYDILANDDSKTKPSDTSDVALNHLSLTGIDVKHLYVNYWDEPSHLRLGLRDASAKLKAHQNLKTWTNGAYDANCTLQGLRLALADSAWLDVDARDMFIKTQLQLEGKRITTDQLQVELGTLTYADSTWRATLQGGQIQVKQLQCDSASAQAHVVTTFQNIQFDGLADPSLQVLLDGVSVSLPEVRMDTAYYARCDASVQALSVTMGKDVYAQTLPVGLHTVASANKALTAFTLTQTSAKVGDQQLQLQAHVDMFDTLNTHVDASFELQPTNFEQLWVLVPQCVMKSLPKLTLKGDVQSLKGQVACTLGADKVTYRSCEFYSQLGGVDVSMNDSLFVQSSSLELHASYPDYSMGKHAFVVANFGVNDLNFKMKDSAMLVTRLDRAEGKALVSDKVLYNNNVVPFVSADFALGSLKVDYDTLHVASDNAKGHVVLDETMRKQKKNYAISLDNHHLDFAMGKALTFTSGPLKLKADASYDKNQTDLLLQYDPRVDLTGRDMELKVDGIPYPVEISDLSFDFNLGTFSIRDSRIQLGHSDFALKGDIYNIRKFLEHTGLLTVRLDFNSDYTNVDELMDIVNGFGTTDSTATAATPQNVTLSQDTVKVEGNPFIVPKGVDVVLNTKINNTLVGNNIFTDLGGKVTIDDGILVLEEMGFSSKAARMQLTALYKSEMRDHLFLGANFHLLDVEISELIHLIPDVDSIVPMLKAFDGKAEFHFAAETNLTSNYDIKMSTLKATAAIEGKDLILMDNETFSTISKYLMFNKKTKNVVDSMSVEMAVARRKATVYPFLISMDKYKAIVSGTHSLTNNMGFNYHISVTDCPLPVRLGLDVTGDMENLDYKVVKCKYANLYKPEKRNATQTQTLELKDMISKALKRTVKEQVSADSIPPANDGAPARDAGVVELGK